MEKAFSNPRLQGTRERRTKARKITNERGISLGKEAQSKMIFQWCKKAN